MPNHTNTAAVATAELGSRRSAYDSATGVESWRDGCRSGRRTERWQDSGAVWEVISRHGDTLTVALMRCDGGEEVDRFTSDDPRLLEFIGDRRK